MTERAKQRLSRFLTGILGFWLLGGSVVALEITRIEPPNWWAGMEHDTVRVLVYGDDFSGWEAESPSRGLRLLGMEIYPNTAYCRLTLKIKKAGEGRIMFRNAESGETRECSFPVRERRGEGPRTITPADVVYLLMPDRFADGDTANNAIPGHKDPVRRDHRWGRRGGDLQGVMEHLDYLEELGITALWMTPVYENNYINCYHGYTPTDTYGVEPFLGSLQLYADLVSACQKRGIKVIQDHIVNHVAPTHPLAQDPPSPEWINGSVEDHKENNYRIMDITDIYGPPEQRKLPAEGWFAGYLADMNMRHPAVVDYWITHAIWWVESAGVDGIRQDTYAYSDLEGMRRWAKELKREYPELFIVGEIMEFDRTRMAYFFNAGQENHLSSVTDFPFSSLIYQLIAEDLPLEDFYREVANDFIYRDPDMMMTFMDNHDMPRFYSAVGGGLRDYCNAWALLFSMRGIPQIYYGDEIGMSGDHDPDNRNVFPGGFSDAQRNAFVSAGRTEKENRIFGQFKAFTLLRKEHPDLFLHPMRHDLREGVYLVWRSDGGGNALLTAYNPGASNREVSYSRLESKVRTACREIKAPLEGEAHIDPRAARIFVPAGETVSWLLR